MLGSAGGGAFVSRSAARRGDGGEGGAHQENVQEDALHAVEPDVVAEVLVVDESVVEAEEHQQAREREGGVPFDERPQG